MAPLSATVVPRRADRISTGSRGGSGGRWVARQRPPGKACAGVHPWGAPEACVSRARYQGWLGRAADDLARPAQQIFCSSCPLSDCPKAVTAKAAVRGSALGSTDLVAANTACRWIFSCVIANANSRLRQTGTGTWEQIQPIGASFGIALSRSTLQLPPLHSRGLLFLPCFG